MGRKKWDALPLLKLLGLRKTFGNRQITSSIHSLFNCSQYIIRNLQTKLTTYDRECAKAALEIKQIKNEFNEVMPQARDDINKSFESIGVMNNNDEDKLRHSHFEMENFKGEMKHIRDEIQDTQMKLRRTIFDLEKSLAEKRTSAQVIYNKQPIAESKSTDVPAPYDFTSIISIPNIQVPNLDMNAIDFNQIASSVFPADDHKAPQATQRTLRSAYMASDEPVSDHNKEDGSKHYLDPHTPKYLYCNEDTVNERKRDFFLTRQEYETIPNYDHTYLSIREKSLAERDYVNYDEIDNSKRGYRYNYNR